MDPAARGSSAAASTGSPPSPVGWPAVSRPARPTPNRSPPAPLGGQDCGGRAARSTPAPARRTCTRCSRRGRRRTGAPSTTLPPAGPQRADPPDDVGTGCAPGSTSAHTGGNANPGPVDARRSPPPRPPRRSGRSPPATDAETEPGNSTHQPQPREHHAKPIGVARLNAAASASRKVGQNHLPRPTTNVDLCRLSLLVDHEPSDCL